MPPASAVPIFWKKSDEKQVIYFTWPNNEIWFRKLSTSYPGD